MCLAFDGVLKPDGRIKKWASNIRRIFVAHVQELTKTVTQWMYIAVDCCSQRDTVPVIFSVLLYSTFTVQILYKLYSLQLNGTYSNYTEAAATCSAAQQHSTFTYKYCTNCTVCNWPVLTVISHKLLHMFSCKRALRNVSWCLLMWSAAGFLIFHGYIDNHNERLEKYQKFILLKTAKIPHRSVTHTYVPTRQAKPSQSSNWGRRLARKTSRRPLSVSHTCVWSDSWVLWQTPQL